MKWIAKLMQFDFHIEYKKGRENKAADSLSRVPAAHLFLLSVIFVGTNLFHRIKASWDDDEKLKELLQKLIDQDGDQKGFTYYNQQLKRYGRLVIGKDKQLRQDIMQSWHNTLGSGHYGLENTYRRLSHMFY